MSSIIPINVLTYLPFHSEPLSSWDQETDLLQFLFSLYDSPYEMVSQNGTRTTGNYRDFGEHLYREGRARSRHWVEQFGRHVREATPAPASVVQRVVVPCFDHDFHFGLALKYWIAFDGICQAVLSESAFFSIEHVLESESELECSFLLAAHLYYKQALQTLRNFLEELLLPIHFCSNRTDFARWRANNYRTPSICSSRRYKGLSQILVDTGILPPDTGREIESLYRDLNASIHGSEARLTHRGIFSHEYRGEVFKLDDFHLWCAYFSRSTDLGIRLLRTNIVQWDDLRPAQRTFCDVCHNDRDFDTETSDFAGIPETIVRCRICGNVMHFSDAN